MHHADTPRTSLRSLLTLAVAVACGGVSSSETTLGSETHFLARCTAACGPGLDCIAGVCTRACSDDAACVSLSAAATCEASGSATDPASCRVSCAGDDACSAQREGWTCERDRCVAPPASFGVRPGASGRGCPSFDGGVQAPIEVETTFEIVPGSVNVEWAHADESGVYWIDYEGGVFGWRKGATTATELRPAPSTPGTYYVLVGDATRLYWAENGAFDTGPLEPGPPPPPGRMLSLSKAGGAPELLAASEALSLLPVGLAPSGRLFVTTSDGFLHEASSGSLVPMTNIPRTEGGLQLVDGLLYWSSYDDTSGQPVLLVAEPGGAEPVRVAPLPTESGIVPFVAGRGIVLWTTGETRFDPLLLVQNFVMFNQNSGCVQELPSVEESIGQTLLDQRHVYWQSFNALGGASPGLPFAAAPILRVDLRTGRFERVVIPGFTSTIVTDLVGQDSTTIYVRGEGDALLAVRKPE